ncbi:MAG: hypothetical protein QOF33_1276 [Thermomicrobiales bacterium]|jgi:hypothetical protein|nr:hypothetical protein [Thermomicrobiales bacterium]
MDLLRRTHRVLRAAHPPRHQAHDHTAETEAEESTRHAADVAVQGPGSPAAVLRLQQTHGNRFVQRLIRRQATETEGDCPGGC